MRKDLFRIIDQMIEDGETIRIRRGKLSVELTPKIVAGPANQQTRAERFDRMMAEGPRAGSGILDYDPADDSHWEWDPEAKFKDLAGQ
ncbi:hypothetical protein ACO2Q1_04030 [Brevundimonas sp. VNH65]|uniref:hypothetical protein n=1 Tax=Brevundimonas sp. VNH65 TaxID=3400917 RepID=UPI003C0605DB